MKVIDHGQGNGIDFKDSSDKRKGFVRINKTNNGVWYLQYHDAKGYMTSYLHEVSRGVWVNENGLYMPEYIYPLINVASNFIYKLCAA